MAKARPFEFTGLPKWTKEQVAVHEGLATYLSYRPFHRKFARTLASELETYLKAPCKFSKPELSVVSDDTVARLVPSIACLVVIGAAPTEHKILIDLDTTIASFCIDRLLGGDGAVNNIQRPLTEIEQGVLSFMLLKVLQKIDSGWQNGRELTLTLDRFASKTVDLNDMIEGVGHYHVLGVKMGVGKKVGYVRILLPGALVTASFSSPPTQAPATVEELDYMRGVLETLGDRETPARVEIANLDLSEDEIASLEVGDIIVLENHEITQSPRGVEGAAFVRIGAGKNGGLRARLFVEGELSKLEISDIVVQEHPAEGSVPMGDGEPGAEDVQQDEAPAEDLPANGQGEVSVQGAGYDAPADNLSQTEGLLRDVSAPVVVELGRITLNTQQVIKLRPGQILRLPRGPNDPVNLVVNDKLFARGELIEVDGELGVRLIQVVGS